jgi:hypothetical protein
VFGNGVPSDDKAKERRNWAEGLQLTSNFKGWGWEIYSQPYAYSALYDTDSSPEKHNSPVHLTNDDKAKGEGNNQLLVFWEKDSSGLSAQEMSGILQADGVEENLTKFDFREVMFVDAHSFCYSHIVPVMGVSELKCLSRE